MKYLPLPGRILSAASLQGQGDAADVQEPGVSDTSGVRDVQLLQNGAVGGDGVEEPVLRRPRELDDDQALAGCPQVPLECPLLPHAPPPVRW